MARDDPGQVGRDETTLGPKRCFVTTSVCTADTEHPGAIPSTLCAGLR